MPVLAGTPGGLVDVEAGAVVDLAGRDVWAVEGGWAVLDRRVVARLGAGAGAPAPAGEPPLTCVAPAPDDRAGAALVGTAGAHLLRAGVGWERVEAFEHAEGRPEWYTPWGGPPDVRTVSTGPGGTVLVNVHVGGILRSTDGGASWTPTIDIDADVHQVLALDGGRAVAACAEGLATSDDDGASWTLHDDGLHATYARSVAVAGDAVLLAVSTGPDGGGAALYRRPLAGGSLERCRDGLPDDLGGNVDTFRLVGGPDGTAALATASGQVYASTDEGGAWLPLGRPLAGARCLVLA
ncbi:MAG TPA: hypothetical protein VM263_02900 [Acidimicrobiales bacterium]|nr:hypothetical protein [Acidimicrobiales bacterium]